MRLEKSRPSAADAATEKPAGPQFVRHEIMF
jgi:hypothetical protein